MDSGAAQTLQATAEAFVEVSLLRRALFHKLAQDGPITGKGRLRAALTAYLGGLDRETRLAQSLGLDRKSRPVDPLEAVAVAVAEANR
jgi:hypothetical protein